MEYMFSTRRVYLPSACLSEKVEIKDRDIIHKIKDVLRLGPGDTISIFDGQGREYSYVLDRADKSGLALISPELIREQARPKLWISLGFPLLTEQKNDLILQKATELGAARLYPFISERNSVHKKISPARGERWQKIVVEACRQSQRLWLPVIEPLISLPDLAAVKADIKLYGDREGTGMDNDRITSVLSEIMALAGPEGGFSPEEKKFLEKQGFSPFRLSRDILRAETAAIFMVGLVSYLASRE